MPTYQLDLEWRENINASILEHAQRFLSGEVSVIATARNLQSYWPDVGNAWPDLAQELKVFVGIDSETDALPIGALREIWHPSTAMQEDEKVRIAEATFRPRALTASKNILKLMAETQD